MSTTSTSGIGNWGRAPGETLCAASWAGGGENPSVDDSVVSEACEIFRKLSPALCGLCHQGKAEENWPPEDSWRRLMPIVARDRNFAMFSPAEWEMVERVWKWAARMGYALAPLLRAGFECHKLNAWTEPWPAR